MKKLLTTFAIIWSLTCIGQTAQEFYNKGNDKANAQNFDGSIKDYDKAIKLDPDYIDAYYNRATSKMSLKDFKGALADYNKAIELRPDFVNAFANRAIAKVKLNDLSGAIQDCDAALKIDPTNASNYFMRGQIKMQSGDTDEGCEDLSKSKELGDKRAEKFLKQYCGNNNTLSKTVNKPNESLMIDWPDAEGWRVANEIDKAEEKTIELLRNKETFDNWTEIGTMTVFKNLTSSMKIPLTKTMELMYENSKKQCGPSSKLTFIEKDENAKYPWIIFKIECGSSKGIESQVWYAIQGTNELYLNFRAVKQKAIPADLQDKWVKFFKSAKVVTQ